MTIVGRKVTRAEFEYSLNKNTKNIHDISRDEIKQYVDMYIDYRLKVQAALDARLDTLSSFKKEYRQYRDAQLRTYVYDSVYADSVAHVVYDAMKESVGDSDLVLMSHILLRVPQNSSKEYLDTQKNTIDSIYTQLEKGASFADLACRFSQDKYSASNGGLLTWLGPSQMMQEFRDAVYSLERGRYSRPFLTAVGYHIVYMNDRKPFGTYEEMRGQILDDLNARGLREDAAERQIRRMVIDSGGNLSREQVLSNIQVEAESNNPKLKYLLGEYYDGLLLYEAVNRMVWKNASDDKEGLEKYFNDNKHKYKWTEPHFRGYVVRAKNPKMLKELSKILKKCRADEGLSLVRQQLSNDSLKVISVHFGIYKKGDNPIVDYKVFKSDDEIKDNKLLPYFNVIGKKYNQPKNAIDVKNEVMSDYQDYLEKNWVNTLREKYSYSVDEDVLSTINNHK